MFSRTSSEQVLQTCFMARGKKLYYENFLAPLISSNKTLDVITLHFIDGVRITGYVSGEGTYELSLLTFSGPVSATFNGIPILHTYNPATGISTLTLTGEGHLDIERQPSIKEVQQLPTEITLHGAAPNPFNPSTTLSFSLPSNGQARLMI